MQENVNNGKTTMQALLEKNTTFATQQAALRDLARAENHATKDPEVKAAHLAGAVTAIKASNLSDAEKTVLIQDTVKNFDAAVDADHQISAAEQDSRRSAAVTDASTASSTTSVTSSQDESVVTGV
ncbi:MAG: hypothetical protein LKE51_11890 [Selenomonas sp.]|jgi:hypothetical protein|nr:hypothetical protein [Selenomonas sp.]